MESDQRSRSPVFRLGGSLASATALAERSARIVRLVRAAIAVAIVMSVGTWGYWYLSDGTHTIVQALYMTVISISTVGFTEVIPIEDDTMRIFTMALILFGGASVVYFLTAVAAFVVEGDFLYGFWRRRLRAQLGRVKDHVIVCGLGRVGSHAFGEIQRSRVPAVGIDRDPARVEEVMNRHGPRILFMVGDAADEQVLRGLGVERARALVAGLADDRDNFLLCVTARQVNPDIKLMVRLVDPEHAEMFDELRADAVVYPPAISGVRLANELLRPELTAFTDRLLAADAHRSGLVEVVVPATTPLVGRSIASLDLDRRTGALVLGVRRAGVAATAAFLFGPSWDHRLQIGDTLLVLAGRASRRRLTALLAGRQHPITVVAAPRPTEILPVLRLSDGAAVPVSPGAARRGHVVVAGAGAVGRSAVRELLRQDAEVVVVDRAAGPLGLIEPHPRLTTLRGDVGERGILASAELATARGFITALQPLRDNLFLSATVHHQNPRARIVARVGGPAEARRLEAVGAAIVNPGQIGGVHMAHRTIHPELVDFARGLEASWDHPEQLAIVPVHALPDGVRRLEALEVHARTGCVILGYRRRATGLFRYHPAPKTPLRFGGALVALGEPHQIERLRTLLSAPSVGVMRGPPAAEARP